MAFHSQNGSNDKTNMSVETLKDLFSGNFMAEVLSHAAIASGQIEGLYTKTIRGQNPDVDAGGPREVLGYGGGTYEFPDTAQPLTLQAVAGESYTVQLTGLDANYDEIKEIVVINGAPVSTTQSFLRLNEFLVIVPGTKTQDLLITHPDGATRNITIESEASNMQYNMYTCPNGFSMAISVQSVSVGKNKDADIYFETQVWTPNGIIKDLSTQVPIYENTIIADFKNALNPTLLPARASLLLEAGTANNNTRVTGYGSLLFIRDDVLASYIDAINTGINDIL